MAVKKGGLGKGLDSLIPSGNPRGKKSVVSAEYRKKGSCRKNC